MGVVLFMFCAIGAGAGASAAIAAAGGTVGAANAFDALFLCPVQEENRTAQNRHDHGDDNQINRIHSHHPTRKADSAETFLSPITHR